MENKKNDISICLNCYKIKFKEKGKPDDQNLSILEVFGVENLYTIYQAFIKQLDSKKVFKNKKEDRVIYLKETLQGSNSSNIFAGIVMKGHNGPETAIDEIVRGEIQTVGKVTSEQFHCHPYFFLLYMRKENPREIIFIGQSYRQFGFKEIFEEAFKSFVNNYCAVRPSVMFNTLSVASLFEKYIQDGKVYKLRFIKHTLSSNVESVLCGDVKEDSKYEMQLSIKSEKGFLGIKNSLKYDDASFIEQVQLDGFDFEEAFADVIVSGRKRVLNISKPSQFNAAYDITREIHIDGATKHPNFNDVLSIAVDILNNDLIPNV